MSIFKVKYFVAVVWLCLVMMGCGSKHELTMHFKKTVVFDNIGYASVRFGGFITTANGQQWVYFANAETGKKIVFYTLDGKKVYEVPLQKIHERGEMVGGIAIVDFKKIIVQTKYNNRLYVIDSSGAIGRVVNLPKTFPDGLGFELYSSFTNGSLLYKDNVLLNTSIDFPTDSNLSLEAAYNIYSKRKNAAPFFMMVPGLGSDTAGLVLGNKGFYGRFVKDGNVNVELGMYTCSADNDYIIQYSLYSDSIYISGKDLTINKAYQIRSKYTEIGAQPLANGATMGDSLELLALTSGLIINVNYDKYHHFYYLSVRHKVPMNSERKKMAEFSPWSIIVLDDNFNYIDELLMEPEKYVPGELLVVKDGILIFRIPQKLNEKTTFDWYEIKKG